MIKETMPTGVIKTEYKCPICNSLMLSAPDVAGAVRSGGYTVWCSQPLTICAAQDVSGHGKNAKEAYDIVRDKFIARKDR